MDYWPFGMELSGVDTAWRTAGLGFVVDGRARAKFTGQMRDEGTGLDYFWARYYSGAMGRWGSADVVNVTRERLIAPSSTLNKYAYGGNSPLTYVDPDGLDITLFYRPPSSSLDINDWGHVFIGAYNQDTNETQLWDYYPAGGLQGMPPKGPGAFNDGDFLAREGRFMSITVQTSPEITQKVIDAIKALKQQPPGYTFPNSTCATTCNMVLKSIGLGSAFSLSPQGLWTAWRNRYSRSNRAALLDGKSFLPPVMEKPGFDYGNPRKSPADWQRFLFDAWRNQPKKACVETPKAGGGIERSCESF
jgi:RHS repeat-associated protein